MLRKKIEFTVTKTRAEVLERINKLIQYSDYVNGYVYNRKDYDFVIIKPSSPIANSFKPVFLWKDFGRRQYYSDISQYKNDFFC